MGPDPARQWAEAVSGLAPSGPPARVLSSLAAWLEIPDPPPLLAQSAPSVRWPRLPPGVERADALGLAYQSLLSRRRRRRGGVFFTPASLAAGLVRVAVGGWSRPMPWRVLDPSCGGGAFLLAAGRRLEADGLDRRRIVEELLWGVDIDPLAVAVTDAALRRWAAETGPAPRHANVAVGDFLLAESPPDGRTGPAGLAGNAGTAGLAGQAGHVDLVIGNPPFLGQLAAGTARTATETAALRARLGSSVFGYADAAALFLVAACRATAPQGGRVAMIVPESLLATRDAGRARQAVLDEATLIGLWHAEAPLFDASVHVCAPVLERDAAPERPVARWVGPTFAPAGVVAPERVDLGAGASWAPLLADRRRVPAVSLPSGPTLATLATATAGFRQHFYGIADHVHDAAAGATPGDSARPRLVTSGLIDPVHLRWGGRSARFAGRSWQAPVVDLAGVRRTNAEVARWGSERLVPKVLVATQTRVLECVVDDAGDCWPSVPVIAVVPAPADLWRVAAVLLAPAVSAWALTHYGGAALSADAVKLSAAQVLEVPLPPGSGADAWEQAAAALVEATAAARAGEAEVWRRELRRAGRAMCAAYGVDAAVEEWWAARLPHFGSSDRR